VLLKLVQSGFQLDTVFVSVLYRMRVEERALEAAFGPEYLGYSRTAKRLIPGLY
jgi:protein-S-isoprenylcysteine O-methyltransferase Ste14